MNQPLVETVRESRHWASKVLSHPVTISLYYFSILGVTFIYDEIAGSLDSRTIIIVTGLLFVMFVAILGVTSLVFRMSKKAEIEDRVRDLQNFISAQQMGWIVNDKYIRSIEFGSDETWVFTRNLVNDLDKDGEIFKSVVANLAAGKRYVYFVPDTPISYQVIKKFYLIHSFDEGQVVFIAVPEENFIFYTEVVAYNVHSEGQTAIEWLPLDHEPLNASEGGSQFYIQMGPGHAAYLVGIGEMYKNKYAPYRARATAA